MTRRWLPFVLWSVVLLLASSSLFSAGHSGGLLAAALALVGLHPSPEQLRLLNFTVRKLGHLTAYGIEGALAFRALGFTKPWRALALALLVAVLDESHQSTVADRTGTPVDVAIDGVGAGACIAGLRRLRRRRD